MIGGSERGDAPPVNGFSQGKPRNRSRGKPRRRDHRTLRLFWLLNGYLRCAFERNAPYHLAAEIVARWARRNGLSEKHAVERVFPEFRRWSVDFQFEKIRLGKTWQWKITPRDHGAITVPGVERGELRARLVGAIRVCLAKSGTAHVDTEFLRKFSALSQLPLAALLAVRDEIRTLTGAAIKWTGTGEGKKLVVYAVAGAGQNKVSDPQTCDSLNAPSGRRNQKTGAGAPGPEESPRRSAPPPQPGGRAGEGNFPAEVANSPPEGRSAGKPAGPPPVFARFAALRPRQFGGRWQSPRKVFAKAMGLAHAELRPIHAEFPRVAWVQAHAVNFAFEALWLGYASAVVVRCWREGVRRSHADAVDADGAAGYVGGVRPPSAAKAYAVEAIRKTDTLTPDERWAAFYNKPRSADARRSEIGDRRSVGEGRRADPAAETSGAVPLDRLAVARAALASAERKFGARTAAAAETGGVSSSATAVPTLGELAAALAARDLTHAQFVALPYAHRMGILRAILRVRTAES